MRSRTAWSPDPEVSCGAYPLTARVGVEDKVGIVVRRFHCGRDPGRARVDRCSVGWQEPSMSLCALSGQGLQGSDE